MRKILTMLLVLGGMQSAYAVPVYMTFEGAIDSTSRVGATNDLNAAGYNIGDSFQVTVMYDENLDGYDTFINGSTFVHSDYTSASVNVDYFYAEYVGGSAPQICCYLDNYESFNHGYNYTASGNNQSGLAFGNLFQISVVDDRNFDDINVGDIVLGLSHWNQGYYSYRSQLTLTYKGSENPYASVPTPATLALFGLGLAGLVVARKKKKA